MMTGKKPKNHQRCKINKQVKLKSAVEILGVLKNAPKNDRTFVFYYPTRDGMNKSAVILFCVLPQAHLF